MMISVVLNEVDLVFQIRLLTSRGHSGVTSEMNGKPIGKPNTLKTLEEIRESMTLTDSDLDFGDDLTR